MSSVTGCEVTLDELAKEQLARLGGRRYPFAGSFELTERCNLRCLHCYVNRPAHSRAVRDQELSIRQIAGILDQIADAGCLHLLLTGGEILLRPDFPQILRHAVQKGFLLTLFTNGTLLTPRMADFLADWRPRRIEITLYGATQDTYERVTQVCGSHARCLDGIEVALQRGLPLALKTVVLRANRYDLPQMRAFAGALRVEFRYDGVLWPRVDGGPGPQAQRLSPQEIVNLDDRDPERALEWQKLSARTQDRVRGARVFTCGAGHHGFHIDCAGRLSACMMVRVPAFDLLQGSFQQGWEENLGAALREKRKLDAMCGTCRAGTMCPQCPGWSQLVHGDNETPVDFVCELGRLRAARFSSSKVDDTEEDNGTRGSEPRAKEEETLRGAWHKESSLGREDLGPQRVRD